MYPHVAQHTLNRVVAEIAVAPVQLQAAVDHLESRVGGKALGLGGKCGCTRLALADRKRSAKQQQPRGIESGRIVGDTELQRLKIGEARPELLALFHVRDRAVQAELRAADRASADIESPAVETGHGDPEALAFLADKIGRRHAAVLED